MCIQIYRIACNRAHIKYALQYPLHQTNGQQLAMEIEIESRQVNVNRTQTVGNASHFHSFFATCMARC